jgi:hypothetical protein
VKQQAITCKTTAAEKGDRQKQAEDGKTAEGLDQDAEDLAEGAALAMWAFACNKACTGIRCVPFFEACCSIIYQNPDELREQAEAVKGGIRLIDKRIRKGKIACIKTHEREKSAKKEKIEKSALGETQLVIAREKTASAPARLPAIFI